MPRSSSQGFTRSMRWLAPLCMILVGLAAIGWTRQLSLSAVLFTALGGAALGLMVCFMFEAAAVLLGDVVTVDDDDREPSEEPSE
jgi:hypothetical protein